jgi:hypothetical protein
VFCGEKKCKRDSIIRYGPKTCDYFYHEWSDRNWHSYPIPSINVQVQVAICIENFEKSGYDASELKWLEKETKQLK